MSLLIGGVTLSGSLVAYLKLAGRVFSGSPVLLPGRHLLNAVLFLGAIGVGAYLSLFVQDIGEMSMLCMVLAGVSVLLGILLVIPIGGADMPVVAFPHGSSMEGITRTLETLAPVSAPSSVPNSPSS